jgi:hypothetical protein
MSKGAARGEGRDPRQEDCDGIERLRPCSGSSAASTANRMHAPVTAVVGAGPASALGVVPCESGLGVCRDARISRIAGAADLVRSGSAQCRLPWTLSSAPAQCAVECETRRHGQRQFSSHGCSAAYGRGARRLVRWSATLAVASRSNGH